MAAAPPRVPPVGALSKLIRFSGARLVAVPRAQMFVANIFRDGGEPCSGSPLTVALRWVRSACERGSSGAREVTISTGKKACGAKAAFGTINLAGCMTPQAPP